MIRKLLRRVIKWALTDPKGRWQYIPASIIKANIRIPKSEFETLFVSGGATPQGRKVIINTIKSAKTNGEL